MTPYEQIERNLKAARRNLAITIVLMAVIVALNAALLVMRMRQ